MTHTILVIVRVGKVAVLFIAVLFHRHTVGDAPHREVDYSL
jgi:hypothetical protein